MSQIDGTSSLSQIMADIDLGPCGSVQFQFAKLQLAQSEICKNEATSYMEQIEAIQEEQTAVAEMIERARELQNEAKNDDKCTEMPDDMKEFFEKRGLSWDTAGDDDLHTSDEWDYNLKSLTNYQEEIGNKTQTLMIYLQDFIGQYNSYQEGAMSAISEGTQTLRSIAKGQ
ncbi:MAG: hypothetical protein IKY97_03690 [Mailhella sp.]|nr:hypothetical protein [Mailhella sp.]